MPAVEGLEYYTSERPKTMIGEQYEQKTRLAVLKVRPGERHRVVLLREEALGYIVHWIDKAGSKGRGVSLLCPGLDCPACMAGLGARWVGLMPCRLLGGSGSRRPVLVEFSGEAWAALKGLLAMEGLKQNTGSVVELTRGGSRRGLRAEPVAGEEEEATRAIPDHVLLDAMATLYGLSRCLEGWSVDEWTEKVRPLVLSRVRTALLQMERGSV